MKASLQEELEETSNKVISTWAAIEFIYPVIVMMLNILCATHACTIHARTVTAPFTSKETCRDNAEATNGAEDEKA